MILVLVLRCPHVLFTILVFSFEFLDGAVAQLGERRVRNAKVGSSILLSSIFWSWEVENRKEIIFFSVFYKTD